jgi:Tol biopolymer transport system component
VVWGQLMAAIELVKNIATRVPRSLALAAAVVAACGIGSTQLAGQRPRTSREEAGRTSAPATRITTLTENGGRLDWSAKNNLIAFDRRIGDGYFDIYTMTPGGADEKCLTCGKSELPPKSKGNPAWHPSGEFIAFQAQTSFRGLGAITDYAANPGAGVNNNIWVMDRQGQRFWRLTDLAPRTTGVLHPVFSPAGDQLFWAERISAETSWGRWALRLADFHVDRGEVGINGEQTFRPQQMYESHGFSPDGEQLLFSGNLEPGQDPRHGDIYLYNLRTGRLTNLTDSPNEWDEHAHFSPDGKTIVWMTSKNLPEWVRGPGGAVRTDYWLMNPDGTNKRRLTWFNTPGHLESVKAGVVAADCAWSPDGSRLAAYLIIDVRTGGKIVMIDLR